MKSYIIFFSYLIAIVIGCRSIFNDFCLLKTWLVIQILTGIYEFTIVRFHKYMCNKSDIKDKSWWSKNYKFTDSLKPEYWVDAWREYAKEDPRYCTSKDVIWFEILNALTIIPNTIILYLFTQLQTRKIKQIIGILLIISGMVPLYGTTLYYITYYNYAKDGHKTPNKLRQILYLLMDAPWIILPLYMVIFGAWYILE